MLLAFLLSVLTAAPAAAGAREAQLLVTNRFGDRIEKATVCVVDASGCAVLPARVENGRAIVVLPRTAGVRLRAAAPGFEPSDLPAPALDDATLQFVLGARGALEVRLVSPNERGEEAAELALARAAEGRSRGRPFETRKVALSPPPDPTSVTFTDLPPGPYVLSWTGRNVARGERPFSVRGAETVDSGTVRLARGVTAEGIVRGVSGEPLTGVAVRFDPDASSPEPISATSEADGRFAIQGLVPGPGRAWTARASGHADARGTWNGESRLEITLEEALFDSGSLKRPHGITLRGRVIAAQTGAPVPGASLKAEASAGDRTVIPFSATAGADGRWEIPGVPGTGAVRVSASAPGLASRTVTVVASNAGPIDLALTKGGRIEGTICGTTADFAYSSVAAFARHGVGAPRAARIDDRGRFAFEAAEPGVWLLTRQWQGSSFSSESFLVSTEEGARVEVEEGRTSAVTFGCGAISVSGTVLLGGAPIGSRYGSLVPVRGGAAVAIRTDPEGRFSVRVSEPGTYEARIWDVPPPRPTCEVPAGGTSSCLLGFITAR